MRGCERRVIYLKNTGSMLFDEAYFVVSRAGEAACAEKGDMVHEANRIIEDSLADKEARARRERGRRLIGFLVPFFLGAVFSALIFGAAVGISAM